MTQPYIELSRPSRFTAFLLAALLLVNLRAAAQAPPQRAVSKLAPQLQAATGNKSARNTTYRVLVQDPAAFRRWAEQLPGVRLEVSATDPRVFTVRGLRQPTQLAESALVSFVDVADRQAYPERENDAADLDLNRIWMVHNLYPNLTGRGLTASIKEEAFDRTDIDFQGRVNNSPLFGSTASDHATAMATFIGGAGNSSPTGRGAAPAVRLASSSFAQLLPDDGTQLAADGVSVQNHSYGVAAIENYYGLEARAYDQQTRQYPALLHVFSAGNLGNRGSTTGPYANLAGVANLTGQFKTSKNTLSVGATDALGRVAALSSRGPAHDGRLKPELVALGEAGTSDAAALVSGAALLVQHAYRDGHGGALPSAALVKAALLNSADDIGRSGPDFEAGFGQTDALGAVQTVLDNRLRLDAVGPAATRSFPLTVPAGTRQLKITLAWADPEAAANAARALVNDLDLELVGTGGQRWRPWVLSSYPNLDSLRLPARRGVDRLNNVEQITVAAPAPGTYQVQVRGHQLAVGSSQDFAVAYEFETAGLSWSNPAPGNALRADLPQRLRWQWRGPAATGRLEYRLANAGNWQTVETNVDVALGVYNWTPPDVTSAAEVRLVVGADVFPSGAFVLSRPARVEVGYACDDEGLLTWPRVPGAARYQVFALGATQLEPAAVVTDTTFLLPAGQAAARYYTVAPLLPDGTPGVRGRTIDYTSQGTACYVRSFLPRELVSAQVGFDLTLGSAFRLRAVHLERETSGGFESVQTLTPVTRTQLLLTDEPTAPGVLRYRARLETTTGRNFYTDVEEVYFVRPSDLLLFPNPVRDGSPVTLLDGLGRPMRWVLFDHAGRLLRQGQTSEAAVPEINTQGIRPGTYLLRVTPEGGSTVTKRLLVL